MIRGLLCIFMFLGIPIAKADTPCASPLVQAQSAYRCALVNHPETRDFLFRAQEQAARERLALQIPNPELEAKARQGSETTIELDITQELELGGKRDARTMRARSEGEVVRLKDLIVAVSVSNSVIDELISLEQVRQKRSLLASARDKLRQLVTSLRERPILTPEQKTTVRIFEIYGRTLLYEDLVLLDEERKGRGAIGAAIGKPLRDSDSLKFSFFKKWPALPIAGGDGSLLTRLAHVETLLAESERSEARSEKWSNLRIGPSFEHDTESGDFSVGAGIEIAIPFWHRNEGAVARADANLARVRAREEATRQEQEVIFKSILDRYMTLTKFLESSPSETELRQGLRETQDLFVQGLIAPASLVENYRSSIELLEQVQAAQRLAFTLWASTMSRTGSLPLELP